jgi:hypothetical protein
MSKFVASQERILGQLSAIEILSLDRQNPKATKLNRRGKRILDYLRERTSRWRRNIS